MVEKNKKRLVVIDGNHLIHRAFYAIQAPLQTSGGERTNAIYGFASMILNILELEKPDYVMMTFDTKEPTFRHDEHEGYKATRVKAPDELYAQIPRIHEFVDRFKIPLFEKGGFEADDLMGTIAKKAHASGLQTFIITGDMDALQLIEKDTYVVFPHKGYREPIIFDADKVYEKYQVYPDQIVDYKAMVGDSSDNIKGVDGIGPKGAVKLLSDYKTLDGIYSHLNEIAPAVRAKLEKDKEQAFFARRLATIVKDVPIEFDLSKAELNHLDFRGVEGFLKELELVSLLKRLQKIMPQEHKVSQNQMSLF